MVEQLSGEEHHLTVSRELRGAKTTVIVADRPLLELMSRLAQVYGAEWRRLPEGGKPRYELRRQREVATWLELWRKASRDAERDVRTFQESIVRRSIEQGLAALDQPLPLNAEGQEALPRGVVNKNRALLVRGLSQQQRDQLAHHIAAITPIRVGAPVVRAPAPVRVPFRDLSPDQQRIVREAIGGPPGSPAPGEEEAGLLDDLHQAVVEFDARNGTAAEVSVRSRSKRYSLGPAVGMRLGEEAVEKRFRAELFRRLAEHRTPPGALLGATLTAEGDVTPDVRLTDATLAKLPLEKLPQNPLARELLPALADGAKLNLVAEYHTRSARLPVTGAGAVAGEVLTLAAEKYALVLRQEGDYLLARSRYWPDRDEEEAPAPLAERFIAAKRTGQGLTLEDLLAMSRLPERQLDGLGAFIDVPPLLPDNLLPVRLLQETHLIRSNPLLWKLLGTLPPGYLKAAKSPQGLPVGVLDRRQQALLAEAVEATGHLGDSRLHISTRMRNAPYDKGAWHEIYVQRPGEERPVWTSAAL